MDHARTMKELCRDHEDIIKMIMQGSCMDHAGTMYGSCRNHSNDHSGMDAVTMYVSCSDHSIDHAGIMQGSCMGSCRDHVWDHAGIMSGKCRNLAGIKQISRRDNVLVMQRSFRRSCRDQANSDKH